LHNAIHALVGSNGGTMLDQYVSAFDPIFWLHHANVDRIFALWQALWPDSYVTSQVNKGGTYTNSPGLVENIDTPLTPFKADSNGNLWTSRMVRSTRTFGYTYPELVDWNVSSAQLRSNVRTTINRLYNPTPTGQKVRRDTTVDANVHGALAMAKAANSGNAEWVINVEADK
jgi:tyrosinase